MHGQLVGLVAEAIRTDSWAGFRSVEHWLTVQAGISTSSAARITSIARRVDELPVTMNALVCGELTVDQAAVVARFVPSHNDAEGVQFATAATVAQLRATLRKYPFDQPDHHNDQDDQDGQDDQDEPVAGADIDNEPVGPAGEPVGEPGDITTSSMVVETGSGPVDIGDRYRCGWLYDDDGNFRLYLTADAFDGKLIETAINTAHARLINDAGSSSGGGGVVTNLAAFVDMVNQSHNAPDTPGPGPADRTRVHIHLDTAGAFVHQGPRIPTSLRDRILCDAVLRPVWETDGHAVNVGRDQRVVPERTRRVIEQRDQCCRFPGCTRTRHLDVHHIIHWIYDGVTDTWNLVLLCPHHHRAHHRGEFMLVGNADLADVLDHPEGLVFTRPDGTRIRACQRPVAPTTAAPAPVSQFIHPTGERFDPTLLAFRQADGTYNVHAPNRRTTSNEARPVEQAGMIVNDAPGDGERHRIRHADRSGGDDGDGSDSGDDGSDGLGHLRINGVAYLDLIDQPTR